jgi:hypothetical protein
MSTRLGAVVTDATTPGHTNLDTPPQQNHLLDLSNEEVSTLSLRSINDEREARATCTCRALDDVYVTARRDTRHRESRKYKYRDFETRSVQTQSTKEQAGYMCEM